MNPKVLQSLGIALLAAGILGAIAWVVFSVISFGDMIDDSHRIDVPGQLEMKLDKGRYTVYYESRQLDSDDNLEIPTMQISITSVETHEPVSLESYGVSLTYQWGSRSGKAFKTMKIESSGRYQVDVQGLGLSGGRIVIGRPIGRIIFRGLIGAPIIFFVLGGFGVVLLALYDKKKRVEKEAAKTASQISQ